MTPAQRIARAAKAAQARWTTKQAAAPNQVEGQDQQQSQPSEQAPQLAQLDHQAQQDQLAAVNPVNKSRIQMEPKNSEPGLSVDPELIVDRVRFEQDLKEAGQQTILSGFLAKRIS